MNEPSSWERAAQEARAAQEKAVADLRARLLDDPLVLDAVVAWVEDPAVNHNPLTRQVLRALLARIGRLMTDFSDRLERSNEQLRQSTLQLRASNDQVQACTDELVRLRAVADAARAVASGEDVYVWTPSLQRLREALAAMDGAG